MTKSPSSPPPEFPPWLSRSSDGAWLIRVKAVPGASRDEIAGPLGDRLKIRIAAPPEGGKANKAIAKEMGLSPDTVKDHLERVFAKLEVRDRLTAVKRAMELGLISNR